MKFFVISVNIKHFFVRLNSAVSKVFICEKMKTTLFMFETPFVSTFAQEPKMD